MQDVLAEHKQGSSGFNMVYNIALDRYIWRANLGENSKF